MEVHRKRASGEFTNTRNTISLPSSSASSLLHLISIILILTNMRSASSLLQHQSRNYHIQQRAISSFIGYGIGPSSPSSRSGNQRYIINRSTLKKTTHSNNIFETSRLFSTTQEVTDADKELVAQTPLFRDAPHLLNGLDTYTIKANDGHPISVYGIHSKETNTDDDTSKRQRRPILMLHGRTWSSVPVYHLLGGNNHASGIGSPTHHSRSLMESFLAAGLQPYCMDFRGFGGTPSDSTNTVIPNQCVLDAEAVLKFIAEKHLKDETMDHHLPALMGWSQGALVGQLLAQKSPQMLSKLVLYGSIYDPMVSYARQPLFVNGTTGNFEVVENTFNGAIEDFTVEGSIPPAAAIEFAEAGLSSDPIKAQWHYLCQFNNCDPARLHVPTLVVAGDQDPYAPLRIQSELFANLGRGADRTWSIIADADHAVHMLDGGKERFLNIVKSFVENGKKGESLD
jgi:pimeloyl-ACP methyl ester carboxylesterase